MEQLKFIYVRDKKIKELLEKSGYKLFQEKSDYWIFLNNTSKNFELRNTTDVVFRDSLIF